MLDFTKYDSMCWLAELVYNRPYNNLSPVAEDNKDKLLEKYKIDTTGYDSTTNTFSYGMIILRNRTENRFCKKLCDSDLASMRNVAGEIKDAEAAMQFALDHGIQHLTIYHDYEGIAKWCTGEWKANKQGTIAYRNFYTVASKKIKIDFVKVTGHSGDKYNEITDSLAKFALGLL